MAHVQQVVSLCHRIDHGSIADRRKAADSLKALLKGNSSVVEALDAMGKSGANDVASKFTWNSVFGSVVAFVKAEVESIAKLSEKGPSSAATALNRSKKAGESVDVLRVVVRQSEQNGVNHLDANDLVAVVLELAKDEKVYGVIGTDILSILTSELLTRRHFWIHIQAKEWRNLIYLTRHLLEERRGSVPRIKEGEAFYQVLRLASMQCCIKTKKKANLAFFRNYFTTTPTKPDQTSTICFVLKALNVYSETLRRDESRQIASVGEDIIPSLANLWRGNKNSDALRLEALKSFRFQFELRQEFADSTVIDKKRWSRCLVEIFHVIVDTLFEKQSENKLSGGSGKKCLFLPSGFAHFAARVIHLVTSTRSLREDDIVCEQIDRLGVATMVEETVISPTGSASNGAVNGNGIDNDGGLEAEEEDRPSAAKRRRLDLTSVWTNVISHLARLKLSPEVAPWLQLVDDALKLHSSSFTTLEKTCLLDTFHDVLTKGENKADKNVFASLANKTLSCLLGMALSWGDVEADATSNPWRKIWQMSLKFSHNKDLSTPCFYLLAAIVRGRLLGDQRHLDDWSLFSNASATPVCAASVYFLQTCLAHECLPHEPTSSKRSSQDAEHPLRMQIMHWLLNFDGSSGSLNNTSDFQSTFNASLNATSASQFNTTQSAKNEAIISNINSRWIAKDRNKRLTVAESSCGRVGHDDFSALPKSLAASLFALTLHEPAPVMRAFVENAGWPEEVGIIESLWMEMETSLLRDSECLYNNIASVEEISPHLVCPLLISIFSQVLFVKSLLGMRCALKPADYSLAGCDMLFLSIQKHLEYAQTILDDAASYTGNPEICWKVAEALGVLKSVYDSSVLKHDPFPANPILLEVMNRCPDSLVHALKKILSHPGQARGTNGINRIPRERPLWIVWSEEKHPEQFEDSKNVSCKTQESCMDSLSRLKKSSFDVIVERDALMCHLERGDEMNYRSLLSSGFDPTSCVHICALQSVLRKSATCPRLVVIDTLGTILKAVGQVFKYHQQDQSMYAECLKILSSVTKLIPQFENSESEATTMLDKYKEVVMKMLLYVRSDRNSFPVPEQSFLVRAEVANTYSLLAEVNPDGKWGRDSDGLVEAYDVFERTCEILVDKCHEARLAACRSLRHFCKIDGPDRGEEMKRWKKIMEVIDGLVESAGSSKTVNQVDDDRCNLTESAIAILVTVASYDERLSATALFTLFDKFAERNHHKVIASQLQKLHERDGKRFIGDKTDSVLKLWIKNSHSPLSFPYELLGYDSVALFLRDHQTAIVASLLYFRNQDGIRLVAEKTGADPMVIMKRALPRAVIDILKDMAIGGNQMETEARNKIESIVGTVTRTEFKKCLKNYAADITFNLVSALNCASVSSDMDIARGFERTGHESTLREDQLKTCFQLFSELIGHESAASPMVAILVEQDEEKLSEALLLFSEAILNQRRHALRHFTYFVEALLEVGFEDNLKRFSPFILREVTTTLCQFVDSECRRLDGEKEFEGGYGALDISVGILERLLDVTLELHCHFVGRLLPKITSTLVKVSHRDQLPQVVRDKSVSMIATLIVENVTQLFPYIRGLFLLPSSGPLADIRKSQVVIRGGALQDLDKEIELFFAAYEKDSADELLISGLEQLVSCFAEARKGPNLLDDAMQRRDSQKLLTTLLAISKSENHLVKSTALKVLGIIGPVNARVVALPSPSDSKWKQHASKLADNPVGGTMRNIVLLKLLDDRLTDANVSSKRVAIRCLKKLFETSEHIIDLLANFDHSENQLREEADLRSRFHFMEYFYPFLQQTSGLREASIEIVGDVDLASSPNLMDFEESSSPEDFIQRMCLSLLNAGLIRDPILLCCKELVEEDASFSPDFVAYLVHGVLAGNEKDQRVREIMSNQLNAFFDKVIRAQESGKCGSSLRKLVEIFLGVVFYLRQQERKVVRRCFPNRRDDATATGHHPTDWDNNFWLDLDYRKVALSASFCDQPFYALMYYEIWFASKSLSGTVSIDESVAYSQTQSVSSVDCVNVVDNAESNVDLSSVLYRIYSLIGEPDALYGCGTTLVSDAQRCVEMHLRERDWVKAASASVGSSTSEASHSLSRSLVEMNLARVAHAFLDSDRNQRESDDYYETALKLSKWDLEARPPRSGDLFYQSVYQSCSALKRGNRSSSILHKNNAIEGILRDVLIIPQSVHALTPILAKLKILGDLEAVQDLLSEEEAADLSKLNSLFFEWRRDHELYGKQSFGYVESVFHLKSTLVRIARECWSRAPGLERDDFFDREEARSTFQFCKLARAHGHFHLAEGGFVRMKNYLGGVEKLDLGPYWELEESFLYWDRKEEEKAKYLLRRVIEGGIEKPSSPLLLPLALSTMGSWLAESNMASPAVISKKYLEEAAKQSAPVNPTKSVDRQNLKRIRVTIGKFADEQYQSIKDHMESSLYAEKMRVLREQEEECTKLMAIQQKLDSAHDRKYLAILQKTKNQDADANKKMILERKTYLEKALQNYLAALKIDAGPSHCSTEAVETLIFRVMTLWFDNGAEHDVNQLIADNYKDIPPHVFLPVISQLTAQLGEGADDEDGSKLFQDTLTKLVGRVCFNHPFHTVYSLLAIVNANKEQKSVAPDRRMKMAKGILDHLKAKGLKDEIQNISLVCDAMIEAAYLPVPSDRKGRNGPFPFSRDASLRKLKNDGTPVPIAPIPVKTNGKYNSSDFPTIQHFETDYKLAGGVNLPKIMNCLGSDGKKYKMLVKGNDDLRQDALMQQIFSLMNQLLGKDPNAKQRHLRMRTYTIIPMTSASGLLEFCQGTMPLGAYLVEGKGGAHAKYHPQSLPANDAGKKMMEVQRKSLSDRLRVYRDICKNFPPVLAHFFWERFKEPSVWYEKRLCYMRSVATSSIVGYILGLGDRHLSNILIDCETAELVHIDFGIAFDQGRLLPIPETIPFRLTRDILDPMGVTGVDGVFKRCAQSVLQVMRQEQQSIRAILDVILLDPMSSWSLSPAKRLQIQKDVEPSAAESGIQRRSTTEQRTKEGRGENAMAKRVTMELTQKLNGHVGGGRVLGKGLSVEGQVKHLIQEARDPVKLCALFAGWKPYA